MVNGEKEVYLPPVQLTEDQLSEPAKGFESGFIPSDKPEDSEELTNTRTELQALNQPSIKSEKQEHQPPEKKSFKELIKLSKSPEGAKQYFGSILQQEYREGRLTKDQFRKFYLEIESFSFDKTIKDTLVISSINLGFFAGYNLGFIKYIPLMRDIVNVVKKVGLGVAIKASPYLLPLLTVDGAGIFRFPYCLARSVQELKKISQTEGKKAALKKIPFFASINILNFIKPASYVAPLFLSFPRNKDVGLAFVNNRVQTGKGPKFIKRFVNWGVQKLFEKPKPETFQKPSLAPQPIPA